MSNDVQRAGVRSVAAKVCKACVLAAFLVAFGSIRSEASTISHQYVGPSGDSNFFNFGDYAVELTFEDLAANANFEVSVTDVLLNPAVIQARFGAFPGYQCVTFASSGTQCVDFEVDAPPPSSNTWTGFYRLDISWLDDTNAQFPNGTTNRIRILHNRGDREGNNFDTDITVEGSYFAGCVECLFSVDDPAIGGRDDNFQSFTVVQAPDPIPEPATMVLVGSGVLGLVRQHRRRRASRSARL